MQGQKYAWYFGDLQNRRKLCNRLQIDKKQRIATAPKTQI